MNERALGASDPINSPPRLTAGSDAPSAPVAAHSPAGALPPFYCRNCKVEWDDAFCDFCGADLPLLIDRVARPSSEERPRNPEGGSV